VTTVSGTFGGAYGGTSTPARPRRPRRPLRRPPQPTAQLGQGSSSITVDPSKTPSGTYHGGNAPPARTVRDVGTPSYGPPKPPEAPPPPPPPPGPPAGPVDEGGYPLTPASAAARTGADEQYGITEGDAHQSLYRAALQYGDPSILQQYGDYGPVVDNPNSDLSTIVRNEALQHTNLGNAMNAQNLYFSGTNQKGQTAVSTEAGKQRSDAYQRFKDAEQRLLTAISTGLAKKRDVYRTTGADDITTALSMPPQPVGTAPGDKKLPAAKKPSSGKKPSKPSTTKRGGETTVSGTSYQQGRGSTTAVRGQGTTKKKGSKKGRSLRRGKK
jgi:hypothetical protein